VLILSARLGLPDHLDANERWRPTPFGVLGLGKLGGHELNYSSVHVRLRSSWLSPGQRFVASR
jgi:hypothetical protein